MVKIYSHIILILFFFFITSAGCSEKGTEIQDGNLEKVEGAPKDAFHGYASGESSPQDPAYHKGTYINEKVGLQKVEESVQHPKTADDVIKRYSEVVIKNPNDASAWIMVGTGYAMKGMYDDAISKYKKALAVKPVPEAYSNMGFAYYDKGEYDNAISSHDMALDLDPKFANSYYGLAMSYEKKDEIKKAIDHWRGYLKVADHSSRWYKVAENQIERLAISD